VGGSGTDATDDRARAFVYVLASPFLCFVVLFLGSWGAAQPCGQEEGFEAPLAGSPRAAYCDNLWPAGPNSWLMLLIPALVLAAGLWVVKSQRYRLAKFVSTAAILGPVIWLTPAFVLSSG
jgi:hypothetical protein